MAGKSNIEWCTDTWNPVRGCSRVSAGCMRCYAERQAIRQIGGAYAGLIQRTSHGPAWTGEIRVVPELLDQPLRWRDPRRIFVNSMSDLFHEGVPSEFIAQVFAVMAQARQHTFQVLTKRPERMRALLNDPVIEDCITEYWREHDQDRETWQLMFPLPNVWLGVSVEDQATADERIPLLLQTPAAVRFVSYEPALGQVDFTPFMWGKHDRVDTICQNCPRDCDCECGYHTRAAMKLAAIDWIIAGGESGPKARACDIAWIRSAVEQCKAAGVACFVKQLGAHPQEIAHPVNVSDEEARRWMADGWTRITRDSCEHWRRYYRLTDRKGGDPAEWPEDLRVREMPR